MSEHQSQGTMDRYFDLMNRGADFSECYSDDVTWLVADTGEVITGSGTVRDYVLALHASMDDARTRTYVVTSDHVFLEGDCASTHAGGEMRTRYCLAYDITDGRISAMRCYGIDKPSAA